MAFSRRTIVGASIAAGLVLAVLLSLPIAVEPRIKRRLLDALGERFDSRVDVQVLTVSLLPRPRISGQGLVLRHGDAPDLPPLVSIAAFSGEAGLAGLLWNPLTISAVTLEGLEINVPPGGMDLNDDEDNDSEKASQPGEGGAGARSPIIVTHLRSERAVLKILRRDPGKSPRIFEIGQLDMRDVGADHPWAYKANLTNPKPPGRIETEGTFGPWNADNPAATPLAAKYRFDEANLGVFDGISGILLSTGEFKGVLQRIDVNGVTNVPAFALTDAGNPMPLKTVFHSIVDGTNGNTLLEPVDATLGTTKIHTSGGVVEREGEGGRTVELDVSIDDGKLEEVLHLAVKGTEPPMTGGLRLTAKFVLPPGEQDVIQRVRLDGKFSVDTARFTKRQVQAKVEAFSTKARGVDDATPDPVASNFRGTFRMQNGVIHFSDVTFSMPGARVNVNGRFVMESEALDFRGTVRLDAKLSQLTTGVKSFFLRVIDGLFRHDDITVVPITIKGTAGQPKVGLDFGRAVSGG
jgi:hypothetical protein